MYLSNITKEAFIIFFSNLFDNYCNDVNMISLEVGGMYALNLLLLLLSFIWFSLIFDVTGVTHHIILFIICIDNILNKMGL